MKDGFSGSRIIVLPQVVVKLMEADKLLSQLHITDIGYFPCAANHEIHRPEGTASYVFIYCIKGRGWFQLDGVHHEVAPNQYFILPAHKPHGYGSDKAAPWTIYWIHFKGNLAGCYASGADTPLDIKPEVRSRISNRINIFEEIYETLKAGFTIENLSYATSLFHYYLGSLRYIHQYRSFASTGQIDETNIVEAAIHYIKENKEKHLTLEMLSKYTGYSVSYFCTMFKKATGHAPLTYINIVKMQEACYLLDNTDMKLNQICHKVGIDDPYYFSRLFTKTIGLSPKAYREQMATHNW
ncbi:MAG: AraC family transcriptional regulator [Bacteroidaceae bacterium]|nr:AraC family transcriptional regulator [Bacteroidaceae bacterium]